MKISASDLPLMRWNILAVSISVLISAAILYGCTEYANNTQNSRKSAQKMLDHARGSLATARQDQENMGKYADEYGALVRQKIIGDDQRLDWMEGMERIRRDNPVISFGYNIAPQMIYAPQPPMDSGIFDIHYSEMKLRFELLHEVQLLNFFAALRAGIKGHYHLEACTLQRTGSDDEQARLKAECSGGWITLKKRSLPP